MTVTEGTPPPAVPPGPSGPVPSVPGPPPGPPANPAPTGGGSPASDGTSATAGGGIDRLTAFDGLFLRAEHLNRIQDYARELALAVGEAAGPGVAEGYEVSVRDATLRVGGGLAIAPDGRPLRSQRLITLPLGGLTPGPNAFWWVEAVPAAWPYGEAPVQGSYCDDPCSGAGTTRSPYSAEGVRIRLTEASEPGLDNRPPDNRRNWLASRLFAAERTAHSPWPHGPGSADLPLTWTPPGVTGKERGVRLAVLSRAPGAAAAWEVDTWTARRERGAPPPHRYWQSRTGMRPWDVFMAQILQFQCQLAELTAAATAPRADLRPLLEQLARLGRQTFLQSHTKEQLGRELGLLVEGIDAGRLRGPGAAEAPQPQTLERLGITELPPAGYLPLAPDGGADALSRASVSPAATGRIETFLGPQVDVRYCSCALDDVAQAVEEAQHRDRIPLDRPGAVDILVPSDGQGRPVTNWVAFVRRQQRFCFSPGEAAGSHSTG
ncbi:hypothetical protein OHS33_32900 [Streptomyces sp. NBC_00536]|uniref:hypothetical protein n=1 Tax=Streptomyces sp. NBC_00536 TaxID=2975769 RepID=UPI002E81A71B|nr:hypothetical protein [Streptomyces sp. NBC_00536]WUC82743.1 hypothetical protein OHS33_32900 [Streptomyces sp. NBC_00536]